MNVLVDTSVWSLALRRGEPDPGPEVAYLAECLAQGREVLTTGLILQEILQGFHGPRQETRIIAKLSALACVTPNRDDHIAAARLRNQCRRKGIQVGTIDALIAQLCIRHELELLTTDHDFQRIARVAPLRVVQV
jgi:predicted nucleic acid-binding protein